MAFKRNDRVEFDNAGTVIYGVVDKGGKTPKVVVDGRKSFYNVPEARLRMSAKPIPPEDLKALGLDGSAPQWKAGDRVSFTSRLGAVHGTVTKLGQKATVVQDGGTSQWTVDRGALRPCEAELRRDEPHEMDRYAVTGFKSYDRMSEETLAFTGTVTFDGRPIAEARNDGHGGCNIYYPAKGATRADLDAFEAAARQWLTDMGMPDRWNNEASDYWLDWKAQKAPFNVTGRDEVERSLKQYAEWGAEDSKSPCM